MDKIEVRAPAKINLFLKILGKRKDGYHDIFSWFQAVNLFDYLIFDKQETGTTLDIEGREDLLADKSNLIIRAADLMFQRFGLSGGLKIHLKKNIPIAAGLGGGSSDAASTIYAISRLYELNLSSESMMELGLEIGTDLPFFFSSGQAEVTGRGEAIKKIFLPLNYYIYLIHPRLMISTAESYARLNLDLTISNPNIKFTCRNNLDDLVGEIKGIGNDFERLHLNSYPVLGEIMDVLKRTGAVLTRMSGSGPTIFGLYKDMPEREDLQKIIRGDWQAFVVWPITLPAWDQSGFLTFGGR